MFRSLRRQDYWPITVTDTSICPACHFYIRPKAGRPDILVLHPTGLSIVVEVKAINTARDTSFSFNKINEDQRNWLGRWLDAGGRGYLALGIIVPHGEVERLDHLYLVDWADWLRIEASIEPYQKSIPWDHTRTRLKVLRENEADIPNLLVDWALPHDEGDYWIIPETHSAHRY